MPPRLNSNPLPPTSEQPMRGQGGRHRSQHGRAPNAHPADNPGLPVAAAAPGPSRDTPRPETRRGRDTRLVPVMQPSQNGANTISPAHGHVPDGPNPWSLSSGLGAAGQRRDLTSGPVWRPPRCTGCLPYHRAVFKEAASFPGVRATRACVCPHLQVPRPPPHPGRMPWASRKKEVCLRPLDGDPAGHRHSTRRGRGASPGVHPCGHRGLRGQMAWASDRGSSACWVCCAGSKGVIVPGEAPSGRTHHLPDPGGRSVPAPESRPPFFLQRLWRGPAPPLQARLSSRPRQKESFSWLLQIMRCWPLIAKAIQTGSW